jgi:hypothetical protein
MANQISFTACANVQALQMSNGSTSVFITTLVLAASELAQNQREREWAVWIAGYDQSIFGSGIVGFDLTDLPWLAASFEDDQIFLQRVVAAAKSKMGWQRLSYEPREDWIQGHLDQFNIMLKAFTKAHIALRKAEPWPQLEKPAAFVKCTKHDVYLHSEGCVVCNDC